MVSSTQTIYDVQKIGQNKWEEQREERALELYDYIENRPNQTAYSLAKRFPYPLRTIQLLLGLLEDENLIKIEQVIENGRIKKIARVIEVKDVTYDTFNEELVPDPVVQKLIHKTLQKGASVFIYQNNGSKIELKP